MMATRAHPAIQTLARVGYTARGIVYVLSGLFTGIALIGVIGGGAHGPKEALKSLTGSILGEGMLIIIAGGLACFCVWRFIQAIVDGDGHGLDARGATVRISLLGSGVTYGVMAVFAFGLVLGIAGSSDGGQSWASWLLDQSWGRWGLVVIALIVAMVGVAHVVKGAKAGFEKHFDVDPDVLKRFRWICQFGLMARGVVFLLVAYLLIMASWNANPKNVGGTKRALDVLDGSWGSLALGIIAIGLFAFGAYSLIEARWRRVPGADSS